VRFLCAVQAAPCESECVPLIKSATCRCLVLWCRPAIVIKREIVDGTGARLASCFLFLRLR
jgi:hypothetical protein